VSDYPVICENIHTGVIGRSVHGLPRGSKETRCGISVYTNNPSIQLSVEPEGTKVTCYVCNKRLQEAMGGMV
jgi:hypothetical protein